MTDLATRYMGLELENPLVVSSWSNSGDISLNLSLRPRIAFSQFTAERFLKVVNKVR